MPTTIVPLNLVKPTVGGDADVWGTYTNENWDKVNALHIDNGTGTSVGMRVGTGKTLKIEDTAIFDAVVDGMVLRDKTDPTKTVLLKLDQVSTGTARTLSAPNRTGTIATEELLAERVSQAMPTGTVLHGYWGNTPPAGFVFADGRTIGNVGSGATNRAMADTLALFTRFWAFNDNTRFPMFNSDGSAAGSRGATAQIDFDALRRITLPDHSGAVAAGRDNLSGTSRNRLNLAFGANNVTWGFFGGVQRTQVLVFGNVTVAGNATGSLTVVGTTSEPTTGGANWQPGADGSVNIHHIHNIGGSTSGTMVVAAYGSIDNNGANTTDPINLPQPTVICDVVIAL